jgi:hypothetical protein
MSKMSRNLEIPGLKPKELNKNLNFPTFLIFPQASPGSISIAGAACG